MSEPPTGIYFIVNTKKDLCTGEDLYITYDKRNAAITVELKQESEWKKQAWIVSGHKGNTQSVSPLKPDPCGTAQQVALKADCDTLFTLPACNREYVWTIQGDPKSGYTIFDGPNEVFWGLKSFTPGEHVFGCRFNGQVVAQKWKLVGR